MSDAATSDSQTSTGPALADVIVIAAAEAFRGDGEIFASGMGTIQTLAARTARSTFEPDLLVSDGEAFFVGNELPIGGTDKVIEGWIPFRSVFDTVWGGRRHVMMGASQIDRFGNTNIAIIGSFDKPKAQLLGVRGGPGNTISHATSFFIPKHTTKVFVPKVDMVSGLGYDSVAGLSETARRHHRLPRVITNLAVLDFETPDHSMRLVSVHPGVTVVDVQEATGFELVIPADVPESRAPTSEEQAVIDRLDPRGLRHREVS
ncbi:MAG: coenzyme transferase [Acidimicrobiales bacterium]|nr:coenzyme transferase [Acidimicrobiales bacterium]